MIKAVIVDVDGVLVDTPKFDFIALGHALEDIHITLPKEVYMQLVGLPEIEFSKELHKKLFVMLPDKVKENRTTMFNALLREAGSTREDIKEILSKLREEGKKIIAMSYNDEAYVNQVISKVQMKDCFDLIINGGSDKKKVSGVNILSVIPKELGIDSADCVVLDDSAYGIICAKQAGMKSIAIPNEFTESHDFSDADQVSDIGQIKKLIDEM